MFVDSDFIKPKGDYHNLIVYKKAECIYAITYHFAHRFLSKGDRTIDQMVQAARSGKQNIIEGSAASVTSRETEIKLFNVAKASLDELLADYEDYILTREIAKWDNAKTAQVREFCKKHNDAREYQKIAPLRDDATLANLCITLIHQEIYLLIRLIERAKADFKQLGGIREEMSRTRKAWRATSGLPYGNGGSYGSGGFAPTTNPQASPTSPNNPITPIKPFTNETPYSDFE